MNLTKIKKAMEKIEEENKILRENEDWKEIMKELNIQDEMEKAKNGDA